MDDLFKNQSNLQSQIKSSILEFNGFSFCKEKKNEKVEHEEHVNDEEFSEESAREFEVHRFDQKKENLKGMSFGKNNYSNYQHQEQPIPRVCLFF